MKNPYIGLPNRQYWRTAVADLPIFEIDGLWTPKFQIPKSAPISTFGSCFAQHIGVSLKARGFSWLITERPPYGMSATSEREFNYGIFSCRTGSIYTTSLLRQWTEWALGGVHPPDESWEADGRFYDPFRPIVEPGGFSSPDEVRRSRRETIDGFARAIKASDIFVFTLGLTEQWTNHAEGHEYPMCPGTSVGSFNPHEHSFGNMNYEAVAKNLSAAIAMMRSANPSLRFILTVSPVPLTATFSMNHVLVATMYSKSTLRAVAGDLAQQWEYVDYFPSYEIINSPVFRGTFFMPNQRNVAPFGVQFVMDQFFNCLAKTSGAPRSESVDPLLTTAKPAVKKTNEVCEEELLEAFAR